MGASKVAVMTPTRVIPNWISEIRSVWPDAIIRVVRNDQRIGTRRPPSTTELAYRPAAFGRASLEEIRRLEYWATPETPLWILMKKDTARASHPVAHGLRYIGNTKEAEPFRPLRALARAEKRAGARPMPTSGNRAPLRRRLYRDQHGRLGKLSADTEPVGTCPDCWYPLTTDAKWKPKDRDAGCLNPGVRPQFPGQRQQESPDDEPEAVATVSCNAPIATAVRDARGRAFYSYGDYASKWLDLLIIDKAQDYKSKDTAQGGATRRMAQRAHKTLALTGTPFGGKVSEVFYLLVSLNPGFARHFNYQDLSAFLGAYGREETTYDVESDNSTSVGVASRRRETKKTWLEIAGRINPSREAFCRRRKLSRRNRASSGTTRAQPSWRCCSGETGPGMAVGMLTGSRLWRRQPAGKHGYAYAHIAIGGGNRPANMGMRMHTFKRKIGGQPVGCPLRVRPARILPLRRGYGDADGAAAGAATTGPRTGLSVRVQVLPASLSA